MKREAYVYFHNVNQNLMGRSGLNFVYITGTAFYVYIVSGRQPEGKNGKLI